MIALEPDTRRRLIASARLLESDKEGERAAALEAVQRLLPSGLTIATALESALSVVVPFRPVSLLRSWQKTAQFVGAFPHLLNERDREFVRDMQVRRAEPTEKQSEWLNNLSARVEARRAA